VQEDIFASVYGFNLSNISMLHIYKVVACCLPNRTHADAPTTWSPQFSVSRLPTMVRQGGPEKTRQQPG
jgi:hypothetical protein